MKKLFILCTVILFVLLAATLVVGCQQEPAPAQPAPTPTPSPTPTTGEKITLADAPTVLDLSSLLPASFTKVDAASEGMSNKDMELGPDASEVELFISEEPFQMIYCFLMIVESKLERTVSDAIFKDEQQVKSMLIENLKAGALEEGFELEVPEVKVTYPDIANLAVLGEARMTSYGLSFGMDMLVFKINKVYVYIFSMDLSPEKQSLVPIAREIDQRIGMFSQ